MAKASAKDDVDLDEKGEADAAPVRLPKKDKSSLQNAFADWKKRQQAKAQPKGGGHGGSGAKGGGGGGGAKVRADDAEAKGTTTTTKTTPPSQAKPPAAFVADAYKQKGDRTLLDKVVDWYTHDQALRSSLEGWFLKHAPTVPPIDMKRVGEGEYPVEAFSSFQEYTAMLEAVVGEFLANEGGTLEELHSLAKDETDVAYSDAWMFVTLFSACTTFLFFADMTKQAQEGDLQFDTTTGLNPKYQI